MSQQTPISTLFPYTTLFRSIHGETIVISTDQRVELVDLTKQIMEFARKFNIKEGIISLWSMHTTCCLFINEFQTALLTDIDRKSTRLNSSHRCISYAVFCLK